MSRKKLITANWKMNFNIIDVQKYIETFKNELKSKKINCDFSIAPPNLYIPFFSQVNNSNNYFKIPITIQNFYFEDKGAFTGEVSLKMAQDFNVSYALIGHSERRQIFNETDEIVNKKIKKALELGITPVFIFGETKAEFDHQNVNDILEQKIRNGLKDLTKKQVIKIVCAYEPIWAVGSKTEINSDFLNERFMFIRKLIGKVFDDEVAKNIILQYGGSVNLSNFIDIMKLDNIDGLLIGGESLFPNRFAKIITYDY